MDENLVDELKRTLSLFDGVTIGNFRSHEDFVEVELRICDAKTLVRLEYYIRAANVQRNLYALCLPEDESEFNSLNCLRWSIRFLSRETMFVFGVFLARDLQKRVLSRSNEMRENLEFWESVANNFPDHPSSPSDGVE
jgi:hypothetical protein